MLCFRIPQTLPACPSCGRRVFLESIVPPDWVSLCDTCHRKGPASDAGSLVEPKSCQAIAYDLEPEYEARRYASVGS
jgi:hypothetical protein